MSEFDPVEEGEYVYRRIAPVFFDESLPIAIQREAFRPTASDVTGISVFRSKLCQPMDALTGLDQFKAAGYYVAMISVQALKNLGLTVNPDPLADGPPGHAIIPEINSHAYQNRKHEMKPILLELARLASAEIVHRPS